MRDALLSVWATGGFTDGDGCQGEICKPFLTVRYLGRNAFTTFLPITKSTSVVFWPEGI